MMTLSLFLSSELKEEYSLITITKWNPKNISFYKYDPYTLLTIHDLLEHWYNYLCDILFAFLDETLLMTLENLGNHVYTLTPMLETF